MGFEVTTEIGKEWALIVYQKISFPKYLSKINLLNVKFT